MIAIVSLIVHRPILNPFKNSLHPPLVWSSKNHMTAAGFEPTPRGHGLFGSHWDWNLQLLDQQTPTGIGTFNPHKFQAETPATALKTKYEFYSLTLYRDMNLRPLHCCVTSLVLSGRSNCNLGFLSDYSCAPLCHAGLDRLSAFLINLANTRCQYRLIGIGNPRIGICIISICIG